MVIAGLLWLGSSAAVWSFVRHAGRVGVGDLDGAEPIASSDWTSVDLDGLVRSSGNGRSEQ